MDQQQRNNLLTIRKGSMTVEEELQLKQSIEEKKKKLNEAMRKEHPHLSKKVDRTILNDWMVPIRRGDKPF